jgi:hypothetical protein
VKYGALLQAGLSRDDVKIVILQNLLPKEDHAIVAARVDGHWLILDNRRLALATIRRWLDPSQNSCSMRQAHGASPGSAKSQPIELGLTNKASVVPGRRRAGPFGRVCCGSYGGLSLQRPFQWLWRYVSGDQIR